MKSFRLAAASILLFSASFSRAAETAQTGPSAGTVQLRVDWPTFLHNQDPVWDRMPTNYFQGPFVGNGLLGTIIFRDEKETNSLRFEIGRTDVYDHRADKIQHYQVRLPIGHLLLTPEGKTSKASFRTDLWNAEITGSVFTDRGSIGIRCFTPSDDRVIVIEIKPTQGEAKASVSFVPEQGNSPRFTVQPQRDKGFVYDPNPPFEVFSRDGMEVSVQPLKAGSDYTTAWKQTAAEGDRTVFVTVANRGTATGSADDAVASLKNSMTRGVPDMEAKHRAWWHSFWPASFISIPDPRLESFYWIQLYKLASATRPGLPVLDLFGPWFKKSVWSYYTHNLNTQLAYYTVIPSNHPGLGENLCRLLVDRQQDLINNVPLEYRKDSAALGTAIGIGSLSSPAPGPVREKLGTGSYHLIALPWLMQQFQEQYLCTMDDERLRNEIQPLLKRTMNTFLHILDLGEDGRYHIPNSFSDEYGSALDANQNLALLRWGLTTLLANDERLKLHDPDAARWKEVLEKLTDPPVSEQEGLLLGKDTPFAKPHRHSSHLFAIFPLHVINIEENPDKIPLMRRSIDHFLSFEGDNCMFKFTGASSLYAAVGDGDNALKYLNRALEPQPKDSTITPNTLYAERTTWPTIESPISAQRCILDMLFQSWGGIIRVFPAMPETWKNASFYHLRAQGAFLVSAKREEGVTRFVAVESLAGEPCHLRTDLSDPIVVEGVPQSRLRRNAKGVLELDLKKGEQAVLHSGEQKPPYVIEPLHTSPDTAATWGLPGM
jgi:hypothetical protein